MKDKIHDVRLTIIGDVDIEAAAHLALTVQDKLGGVQVSFVIDGFLAILVSPELLKDGVTTDARIISLRTSYNAYQNFREKQRGYF